MSPSGDPNPNSATETPNADAPLPGVAINGDVTNGSEASESAIAERAVAPLDYPALARFLLEPLTDLPGELQVTSEVTAQNTKVWLRVSLGKADRGRAFGRGGRNIRAIRTVLRAAGKNVGQSVSLEIIGDESDDQVSRAKPKPRKAGEPRSSKPKLKPRSK